MVSTDEHLEVLRVGCFKYFMLGGDCIQGPVSLLAGCVFNLPSKSIFHSRSCRSSHANIFLHMTPLLPFLLFPSGLLWQCSLIKRLTVSFSLPLVLSHSISADRFSLFYHFFSVAFYAIWVMFTHPRPVTVGSGGVRKEVMKRPGVEEYPGLLVKAVRVVSRGFFREVI